MDKDENSRIRRWLPVILSVAIVLAWMLANSLLVEPDAGPRTFDYDAFERVQGDLGFVKWSSGHVMEDIEPNTLIAVVNGRIVGQFQFQSGSYRTLLSAGVTDKAQRFWVNVDHSESTYHVNYYPRGDDNVLTQPELTFVDTDGDGLTDRRVDWLNKRTHDAKGPPEWSLLKPASESAEP